MTNRSHNEWRILTQVDGSEMYKPFVNHTGGSSPVLTTFNNAKFSVQNVGGGTQKFFPKVIG